MILDFRLVTEDKVIETLQATSAIECVYYCYLHQSKSCKSINFRKQCSSFHDSRENCELLSVVDLDEPTAVLMNDENFDHLVLLSTNVSYDFHYMFVNHSHVKPLHVSNHLLYYDFHDKLIFS